LYPTFPDIFFVALLQLWRLSGHFYCFGRAGALGDHTAKIVQLYVAITAGFGGLLKTGKED
jgi:hypothetical protein